MSQPELQKMPEAKHSPVELGELPMLLRDWCEAAVAEARVPEHLKSKIKSYEMTLHGSPQTSAEGSQEMLNMTMGVFVGEEDSDNGPRVKLQSFKLDGQPVVGDLSVYQKTDAWAGDVFNHLGEEKTELLLDLINDHRLHDERPAIAAVIDLSS